MVDPGDASKRAEIVDDMLEVGDQCPLAIGVTVPEMIVGVHNRAPRRQRLCDMSVATSVLRVAVDDLDDAGRHLLRVPSAVEDPALRPGEGRLEHAYPAGTSINKKSSALVKSGGGSMARASSASAWETSFGETNAWSSPWTRSVAVPLARMF